MHNRELLESRVLTKWWRWQCNHVRPRSSGPMTIRTRRGHRIHITSLDVDTLMEAPRIYIGTTFGSRKALLIGELRAEYPGAVRRGSYYTRKGDSRGVHKDRRGSHSLPGVHNGNRADYGSPIMSLGLIATPPRGTPSICSQRRRSSRHANRPPGRRCPRPDRPHRSRDKRDRLPLALSKPK
jgi:hypothetical protein